MKKETNIFLLLEQEIAYHSSCQLRAVSLTKLDEGWRLMLKVTDRRGRKMVSFTTAPTADDCFYLVDQALNTKSITLKWKDDKY